MRFKVILHKDAVKDYKKADIKLKKKESTSYSYFSDYIQDIGVYCKDI
ncbi:MAG: hypothetical protein HY578_03080 [Nitrospinae bacterium]|nr:hypothetical protein [Nitrospinota bacterium]